MHGFDFEYVLESTAAPTSEEVLSPTVYPSVDGWNLSTDLYASSSSRDSIFGFSGDSLLFLIIIFVLFGLCCFLVGILAACVVFYRTKKKKNEEIKKLKAEISLQHVSSLSDNTGKSQLEVAGMSYNSDDNSQIGPSNDLISLQLPSQPRVTPNPAIDIAISRSNMDKNDGDDDEEVDGLREGRNGTETSRMDAVNDGNVNGSYDDNDTKK